MLIFPVACVIDLLFFQKLNQFDSYVSSLEAILVLLMGITLMSNDDETARLQSWRDNPVNWFNTGLMLYFAGSLFPLLLSNVLLKSTPLTFQIAWSLQSALVMVMYLLFSVGFIRCKVER